MDNIPQVWLIFLGSILTFLSMVLVEYIKNKIIWKRTRQNFKIFVKLELSAIDKSLEKLKNTLENGKYFNYMIIGTVEKSVGNLEGARHDVIYLSNSVIQEKYFDLATDISLFLNDTRGAQGVYDSQGKLLKGEKTSAGENLEQIFKTVGELEKFFSEKRMEKLVELIDLKRRLGDFIRELDKK